MKSSPDVIPESIQRWLLDPVDPGARYLAIATLYPGEYPGLADEIAAAHQKGPIRKILAAMDPAGFWVEDGPGYYPKYRGSAWSLILLSQLGARAEANSQISLACCHYLDHALSSGGQLSINGNPSGTVDCLQGNILAAVFSLNYEDDRLSQALDWMARSATGEGMSPSTERSADRRYYAGKCGPGFLCGANNKQPCAWGAVKVLLALSKLPPAQRTPLLEHALQRGLDLIFSVDPATADYPNGWNPKPSGNWWKFGFPVFYVTDLLQICEVLYDLGLGDDPRLKNAQTLIREKSNSDGTWSLEYHYTGKTWIDPGKKGAPNKYVSIRAFHALGSRLSPDACLI